MLGARPERLTGLSTEDACLHRCFGTRLVGHGLVVDERYFFAHILPVLQMDSQRRVVF